MVRVRTSSRRAERGMTLVELVIVMLVIGLTMGLAIPTVSNITKADLRANARRLAGSIRYGYDLAARKSLTFRLVLDLDNRAWWLEAAGGTVLLDAERQQVRDGAVQAEESRSSRRFVTRHIIESGDMWHPKTPPGFTAVASPLTPKVTLPDGVTFKDVWVAHQSERVTAGLANLYFFPTGLTERAVLHLIDEDDNVFTLWVHPLTGRVEITPEYLEAPDE